MYDPRKALTPEGYDDYRLHLKMMEKALWFLGNNADDLHLGATDDMEDWVYDSQRRVEALLKRQEYDEDYDESFSS